jgi:hypothetical protein
MFDVILISFALCSPMTNHVILPQRFLNTEESKKQYYSYASIENILTN